MRDAVKYLHEAQKGLCFYCREEIPLPVGRKRKKSFNKDHFVPREYCGHNDWRNMVLACPTCNKEKGNRKPTKEEWRKFYRIHEKVRQLITKAGKEVTVDGKIRPKKEDLEDSK